ncbi:MAG: chromate efflux transporter [Candidatus Promineifilaceae bacterium]|nr:chromate efflux transporter [Candidatus Promineifilaceae bacterium]
MQLLKLARLFFKLGIVGFGGPAAHIAMMEDEVVVRRDWMSREHFLDLVGATNLIPGPNSTEMTMHVGYTVAGAAGLVVAGASFILPAAVITGAFAWLYVRYGTLPQVEPLLFGIKPAVLAVILGAVWRLGKTAAKSRRLIVTGAAVTAMTLLGLNEVLALLVGGVGGALWLRATGAPALSLLPLPAALASPQELVERLGRRLAGVVQTLGAERVAWLAQAPGAAPAVWQLGLFFLLVGSILYGSGYVLVAFLEGWLVHDFGWLTQQQLLDAIAIGQFTPGPVLTTSTFIGYMLGGTAGAVVSTAAIFAPSFLFVLILNPWVPRLRESAWTAAFLDAVNASAVGLMAAVVISLGVTTLTSWQAWLIALAAAVLLLRWRVSAPWLVLGGAVVGWLIT